MQRHPIDCCIVAFSTQGQTPVSLRDKYGDYSDMFVKWLADSKDEQWDIIKLCDCMSSA